MNKKAADYIRRYAIDMELDGRMEQMLPLDRLQGFFDLLQPSDVPPAMLQRLYEAQSTGVAQIREQLKQAGWIDPTGEDSTT